MKNKNAKASKSFSNLNTKNLVPRTVGLFGHQRKKKNYLYENGKTYESRVRNSNSIYNNRKGKKCYSLIGESVRRLKYDKSELKGGKIAGNKRRLRNLVRDKSMKVMQDYSNKNLTKNTRPSQVPKTVYTVSNSKEDFNNIIEEKLKLLKTKLVHKSYEDSKHPNPLQPSSKTLIGTIEENEVDREHQYESNIPKAPFNSITMREVTPRFNEDSSEKANILKNSSILKRRTGNIFENDYSESTGKKSKDHNRFSLGEFIRKHDPSNVFNEEDSETMGNGNLHVFKMGKVKVGKLGDIEQVSRDPVLRVNVLNHLRSKYTMIMNN